MNLIYLCSIWTTTDTVTTSLLSFKYKGNLSLFVLFSFFANLIQWTFLRIHSRSNSYNRYVYNILKWSTILRALFHVIKSQNTCTILVHMCDSVCVCEGGGWSNIFSPCEGGKTIFSIALGGKAFFNTFLETSQLLPRPFIVASLSFFSF